MSARASRGPRMQRGQAMTELAIMAVVLVPLFLLMPVLAKYVHLRQTTQQAARAAAWQATVTRDYAVPERMQQQSLMVDRHFAAGAEAIVSTPSSAVPDAAVGNVMFNTFSNRTLLRRGDVHLDGYDEAAAPGPLSRIIGLLDALPGGWGTPNARGLVTARVHVSPQNLQTRDGAPAAYLAPFDRIDLRMDDRHTVLADAWNASGPAGTGHRSVLNQVEPLVPTSGGALPPGAREMVRGTRKIQGVLRPIGSVLPFAGVITRLEFGHIDPDVVPADKLEPYAP